MPSLLEQMLERLKSRQAPSPISESPSTSSETVSTPTTEDANPPIDAFTENIAYHWRRYETLIETAKKPSAYKPEAAVLKSIKTWAKKLVGIDCKRVSVGKMRTQSGYMMNFGGKVGESDLIFTPHKGQPFERQIHVEVKRPDVIIDGKKVQAAGKQSPGQKAYQAEMEARGDVYVVVTSVAELRDYMVGLGFTDLPKAGR